MAWMKERVTPCGACDGEARGERRPLQLQTGQRSLARTGGGEDSCADVTDWCYGRKAV